jgi:hypothetical protein
MNLTTVTLGQLVDGALEGVQAPPEVGRLVVRTAALGEGDGGFQLVDASIVAVTDIIEFADELMFVTAKSDDSATATLTVIRGYYGTTPRTHAANEVGVLNPRWARKRVASLINESFTHLESGGVQIVVTDPMIVPYVDPYDNWTTLLPVPEGARRVWNVRAGIHEIAQWHPVGDLPEGDYPDTRVIRLPRHMRLYDGPYSIVYQMPYRWSDTPAVETSTVEIPEGAEFLPALYAAWKLTGDREVSRSQVDRSEEWTAGQRDTGPALVRLKREEFYGALLAAKSALAASMPDRRRPHVAKPVFTGMSWRSYYS